MASDSNSLKKLHKGIVWTIKHFSKMGPKEIHDVLYLRNKVFIVEQKCPYDDIDGKDVDAYHVMGSSKGVLIAYGRILKPGVLYQEASFGRVLIAREYRKKGAGKELMGKIMKGVVEKWGDVPIRISAQSYLQKFYREIGFKKVGKEYKEDSIPHIEMLYTPKAQ